MEKNNGSKKKKVLRIIRNTMIVGVSAVMLGIVSILLINTYVKNTAGPKIDGNIPGKGTADCILVLGAGLRDDGTPNLVLRKRLDRAVELYVQGVSDRILMTGDHGRKDYNEVRAMKQYAMDHGVPEEAIFMDHAGFSTYDSMYRAKEIFDVKKPVIVTQNYHEYRAVFIADKLGMDALGASCDDVSYYGRKYQDVREALARVKDFLYVVAKPKPKYLGEKIPITGSGLLTEDEQDK